MSADLPELPEPFRTFQFAGDSRMPVYGPRADLDMVPLFTADQMRARDRHVIAFVFARLEEIYAGGWDLQRPDISTIRRLRTELLAGEEPK